MEKKLPAKLLCIRTQDGAESYISAYEDLKDVPEDEAGTVVGVYRLTHTRTLRVDKTLSNKKEA